MSRYGWLPNDDSDYNFDQEQQMYEEFEGESNQELQQHYAVNVGWFRVLNFARPWLHLRKHIKSSLTVNSFPDPQASQNSEVRASAIYSRLKDKKQSARRLLFREFRCQLLICCLLVLLDFMIKLGNSLLMGHLIRMLTTDSQKMGQTLLLALFFGFLFIGIYTKLWVYHYCNELGAKMRFTLSHLVYFKTMKLSNSTLNEFGLGRLVNLVSNDFNDLDNGLVWVIQLFMLPINLTVATYVLWQNFKYYSIVGLLVLILSLKLQDMISKTVKEPIREKNKISDKRVYYCKQLVRNIKAVKMYVWEAELLELINNLRKKQTQFNFNIMLSQGISKILSYFSLMISVLSMVLTKVIFQPSLLERDSIYASIGIFGVIRNTNFNGGLNYLMNIRIILERVDSFLQLTDVKERNPEKMIYYTKMEKETELQTIVLSAKLKINQKLEHKTSDIVYVFKKDNTMSKIIGSLDLTLQKRLFVFGQSGSGKTSFIEAFLNQSKYYNIANLKGTLAYVPQEPVLFNGTIKENILFGSQLHQDKLKEVIRDCCLDRDLQRFSDGIDSPVTMQGASFSGGQRARIALARALYSQSQIIVFDNCLSALDPKVRKEVHRNIFSETYSNRTFIYSTSSEDQVLPNSFLIHIVDKVIKYFSVYREGVLSVSIKSQQLIEDHEETNKNLEALNVASDDLLEEDTGQVSNFTYLYYVSHFGKGYKGIFKIAVVITIFVCCQVAVLSFYKQLPLLGQHTWLRLKTIGNYLTMYLCLDYLRMYVMVMLAATNSFDSHDKFIKKIAYAQYGWFSKKEPQLVNVFANHVGVVDRPLPSVIYDVVKGLMSNLIYILSLCFVTPAFIPLAILLTAGLWMVKRTLKLYIQKSKLYELKYRSPVYNQLAQVFVGSTVIRAFGCQKQFSNKFRSLVYNSQKTYFAFTKMNRFFQIILQFIVYLMILLGVTFTIIFNQESGHKSANLALSMFTLINMTSQLSFNLRQTLTAELNLLSLEKVLSYRETPTEDLSVPQDVQPALSGDIVFKNVKMKYPGSNNYCLNDLNMTIREGQKVALMGRTGAGKSSIFMALYRLFETEPESIITLGGRDIKTMDLYTLRKKCLSSSVQDPVNLPPLTSDASPSQLKYQSIVNGQVTPVKCLDEPFANIDSDLQDSIWKQISRMRTVLAVVHSGRLQRWDRILILEEGRIAKEAQKSQKHLQ